MGNEEVERLRLLAAEIRLDTLAMLKHRGYGHIGGSLSIVELLAVLYGKQLKYDIQNPQWSDRDQVVLSKGHAGPALYSALAKVGFFDPELLFSLNEGGTSLPSHPDRLKTPGIDATTGSLGQGTSVGAGIAMGIKMDGQTNDVYLIVGDGELNEGQCWEAFQFIAHFKLNHCMVIIDENKKQLDGTTAEILNPFDLVAKMRAFGFTTLKVKGDNLIEIDKAITFLKGVTDRAVCLILDTVKGQGVKYFEELDANHSVKFNQEEINRETAQAMTDLKVFIAEKKGV